MAEQRWVFLADPTDYGWDELVREKTAVWDGVRNARAQSNLRKCRKGDPVLVYHTAPEKAIVGLASVTGEARPDPKNERLVVVEVRPVKRLARPLPLAELKADATLAGMSFVRMPRVAVQSVRESEWARVLELSGTSG
ncbi:MAG: EVE domain-containing protein [Gemmatimonadetes bacterium]|nr:EVE domain-containing protein [Gemmatimonadota bacterium]